MERINGDEARRMRERLSDDSALITMALATRGTNFCKEDVVRFEWELAKELGINITVHVAMDRFGYTKMQLRRLQELDLLYPNTTYIHSCHLLDDEWDMVAASGGNVSVAPQIELQMGHGWAPGQVAAEARHSGGSFFRRGHDRVGRPVHADARHLRLGAGAAAPGRLGRGPGRQQPTPDLIDSRQVLRWATIDGARVAGVADRTGSITPGKKADLVIIDTKAVNVAPVIDPVGAVVCAADISNVRTVLVDGRIVKDDFKLKADLSTPRQLVEASRDYLVGEFGEPEPGWLVREPAKETATA